MKKLIGIISILLLFGVSAVAQKSETFPAVFGMPPKVALTVAVFTEFFCALFVILGLFTRPSAVLVSATMAVAACVVHANDPCATKEMALLYLVGFVAIALLGPGTYSVESQKNMKW